MRFAAYGSSISRMDMQHAQAPWIFVQNLNNQCKSTLYVHIKPMADIRLISVRGGIPSGAPCDGDHYHSYLGRVVEVLSAVARWITSQ